MLRPPPILARRKRGVSPSAPAPLGPPALVAAAFDADDAVLTLVFDRDVSTDGLNPGAFGVADNAATGWYYFGTDVQRPDGATVTVAMTPDAPAVGTGVLLFAPPDSGVVAADDAQPWAGADGVGLPFP